MACRTRPADASNPLTKVGRRLGGVAHSAPGRGACSIYEAWLYSQRLGITNDMSGESSTPWYSMEASLYPPSPCLNLGPHSGEAKTRDCDTVPVRTKHSGGRPNV